MPRVVAPDARRLNFKIDRIRKPYIKNLENLFKEARVLERLREIKRTATYPLNKEAAAALEKIDKEMEGYMLHAKKKCRKFYANHYDFSPTVKLWLDRCHLYKALIKLKLKMEELNTTNPKRIKDGNPANTYRTAGRCGIDNAKKLGRMSCTPDTAGARSIRALSWPTCLG